MKILHINGNYIRSALHQRMIEALDEIGIENQVFVPTYDSLTSAVPINDGVIVSECFNKWDRVLFYYKQKKILKAIEYEVEVKKYDCIHAYTLFTDGNVAMQLSQKYDIPYVVAVRNTDVNFFFKKMPFLRKQGLEIIKNAKAVFFLSHPYKEQVLAQYVPEQLKGILSSKIYVIPNGIDSFWHDNIYKVNITEKLKRFSNKQIKLIYVGRIDQNKNIPTIQKAIEVLNSEGYQVELTVVGKIDDLNEFNKIQNSPFTIYMNNQPKEDLLKLYRESDIFIMVSHYESFGLVYAEAMSQGLPIIYTRGQGFDGQFKDGLVGYGVSDIKINDLVKAIKMILLDYVYISANAQMNAQRFNWNDIALQYSKIYNILMNKR